MSAVREESLLKALSDLEDIAKGDALPKDQKGANGGLSKEGKAMAVKSDGREDDDEEELEDEEKSFSEWLESESALLKGDEEDESQEDEGDDEGEEEAPEAAEEEDEGEEDEEAEKSLGSQASISDIIKSNSATGPVVDVAPFIETLVDQVSDSDENLRKSIVALQDQQSGFNDTLQKSIVALGNLVLDMNKKLNSVWDAPVSGRKSVMSKSEVAERFEAAAPAFNKTQVLDTMVELVQKGHINPIDVSRYEATNSMEPNVRQTVETYLKKIA